MKIRIISWNVAGMRAAIKKGLWGFMEKDRAEIYCFQETKAKAEQVPTSFDMPTEYLSYYNPAQKAGYSGVATFTKLKPVEIINGMGLDKFDNEGRVIVTKFKEFTLLNIYFPNGGMGPARLDYKMEFYDVFFEIHKWATEYKARRSFFCWGCQYGTPGNRFGQAQRLCQSIRVYAN